MKIIIAAARVTFIIVTLAVVLMTTSSALYMQKPFRQMFSPCFPDTFRVLSSCRPVMSVTETDPAPIEKVTPECCNSLKEVVIDRGNAACLCHLVQQRTCFNKFVTSSERLVSIASICSLNQTNSVFDCPDEEQKKPFWESLCEPVEVQMKTLEEEQDEKRKLLNLPNHHVPHLLNQKCPAEEMPALWHLIKRN